MSRLLVCLVLAASASAATSARAADSQGNAAAAMAVLKTHCYKCHGEQFKVEGMNVLDVDGLLQPRRDDMAYVTAGSPKKSAIYQRMARGDMPPRSVTTRPTPEELQAVEAWITAGAPRPRVEGPA